MEQQSLRNLPDNGHWEAFYAAKSANIFQETDKMSGNIFSKRRQYLDLLLNGYQSLITTNSVCLTGFAFFHFIY